MLQQLSTVNRQVLDDKLLHNIIVAIQSIIINNILYIINIANRIIILGNVLC